MADLLIAQTIFNQIGGCRFKAMVGASHFAHTHNALRFRFKMCNKANVCLITLNGLDLYDLKFFKCKPTAADSEPVKTYENLYFDQLTDTFEKYTGLYTSL